MDYAHIIKEFDAQIARLQEARDALAAVWRGDQVGGGKRKRGRRRGGKLSAAARAKIAAAQRARWAKVKGRAKG